MPAMNSVYSSNVQQGSELSSSASVEMAFTEAGKHCVDHPPMKRTWLAQKVENKYVGIDYSIIDQFARAGGEEDHLLCL